MFDPFQKKNLTEYAKKVSEMTDENCSQKGVPCIGWSIRYGSLLLARLRSNCDWRFAERNTGSVVRLRRKNKRAGFALVSEADLLM